MVSFLPISTTIKSYLTLTTLLLGASLANAQNFSFGADNFYHSRNVTVESVNFPNLYQMNVAGNLFTPYNFSRDTPTAAIVIGHPMGAVKEQSSNLYAAKLAEQGFVTLAVDISHWGASEGEPRNAVLPDVYADSFSAAVDYLSMQAFIDRERIGALGICGSGSFVISAAKIDPRMKAIGTVSMYDMGAVNRNGLRRAVSVSQRKAIIASAITQRQREAEGQAQVLTGGTPHVLTANSTAEDREFFDFYRTPRGEYTPSGSSRNRTTQPTLSSNTKFMNFYPFNDIDTISPRPMLFVAGDQAHSREFSEDAYAAAGEPKELYWVEGAGHVDLYDRVDLIPFGKLVGFFDENLRSGVNGNLTVFSRRI